MLSIKADNLFSEQKRTKNQILKVGNGKILKIEDYENQDFDLETWGIAPGLFDSHINGGEKFHFTKDANIESISDIYLSSKQTGTSYVLPTLITSPLENIFKGIDAIRNFQKKIPDSGVLGMHLEGPFLNIKKRGAHLEKYILKPEIDIIKKIIDYADGTIKLWTIAAENFDDATLNLLIDSKICISMGHSNASFTESKRAFDAGISTVTHLYNAMSAFNHRAPGLIGAALSDDRVFAPIILDGQHSDYEAAKFAYKNKREKLFLISDALFLNRKVKEFKWGEFDATYQLDAYYNSEKNLAGGALSLPEMVKNAVFHCGIPIEEALHMASGRVFEALNLNLGLGKIEVGCITELCIFGKDLKSFKIL